MCIHFCVCSILSTSGESQERTLIDGISALMIFCKLPELKAQGAVHACLHVLKKGVSLTLERLSHSY